MDLCLAQIQARPTPLVFESVAVPTVDGGERILGEGNETILGEGNEIILGE